MIQENSELNVYIFQKITIFLMERKLNRVLVLCVFYLSYAYIYINVYIYMYVSVYVRVCMYIHIHTLST